MTSMDGNKYISNFYRPEENNIVETRSLLENQRK